MLTLQEQAIHLLDANARRGKGYYYTAPSPRKYPHQWSWDSAFCAIANCRLGRPELAEAEILSLLGKMLPGGALPHLIFHKTAPPTDRALRFYWPHPDRSPLVQPPVVALAVRTVWEQTTDSAFLREVLPPLEKHFNWLHETRRFGASPLVSIFSPWESGLDHKPSFDPLLGKIGRLPFGRYVVLYLAEMELARLRFNPREIERRRYFNVREVLFNTIYALGLEALGKMFAALGENSKAAVYSGRYQEVQRAILTECFDPATGLYFDVDVRTGRPIREPTIASLAPIALGDLPADRAAALLRHLANPMEFWLPFPVPSVPRHSRHFRPRSRTYLWRGPTWINTNWLLVEGLRRQGHREPAEIISRKSRELVEKSGFREYYDPLTGQGQGQEDFSWSALAAII